jgi:broad specificity phosphatase PhoE
LTRTLETADIIRDRYRCPIIVHDGCREGRNGDRCNDRRSVTELKEKFPSDYFDWSEITDLDTLTDPGTNLKDLIWSVRQRASVFMTYLCGRPETNIVVVSHVGFIRSVIANIMGLDREHRVLVASNNCDTILVTYDWTAWSMPNTMYIPSLI